MAVARGGVEAGEKPLGREEQFDAIQKYTCQCFAQSKGGVIYAAGISGTGKSVTVHSVMAGIWKFPSPLERPPALVSINCMHLVTPKAVYEAIWSGYEMHRDVLDDPAEIAYPCQESTITIGVSKCDVVKQEMMAFANSEVPKGREVKKKQKSGKKRTKRHQDHGERSMLVVFLDEIDKLINRNIDLLLDLFSMAASSKRMILIGAANTLDLTDRWMEDFKKANCTPELVTFQAYRPKEVTAVLKKLTTQCQETIVLSDRAIEFMARKACSTGMGDMRSVFHVCLSALSEFERSASDEAWVGIKEITEVFDRLQAGAEDEPYSALSSLPLDQQVLLLAIAQLLQRNIERCAEDSPEKQPRKKCTSSRAGRPDDGLDVGAIYQQYVTACKDLCLDANSKTDVLNMATMLCDAGVLSMDKPKKGKRFHLSVTLTAVQEFFESSRLFAGIM